MLKAICIEVFFLVLRCCTAKVPLTHVTLLNATNSDLNVTQGTDITLVCETSPTVPNSTITWRRDGQSFTQGVISYIRQENEGMVTVSALSQTVQWIDWRTYSCEALNSGVTRTSQSLTLVVQVPVSSVNLTNITSNNQQVPVNQDSSLVLTCQSSPAYPAPIVTWYVRSNMTTSGVDSWTEPQWTSEMIVTVSTITRTMRKNNNQDTFYCRAENIKGVAGTESKTARANVFYPPDISLSPIIGTQATNLTLTCIATGNPSNYRFEDFRQYWGDQLIRRRIGTKKGDRYSLDLTQVSYQDSGVYVCTVGNNVKQPTQKNTTVTVQASPVFTKAELSDPVDAGFGQTVTLVQYVYCSPKFTSVSWHFDNRSGLDTGVSSVSSSMVHLDVYGTHVEVLGFKLIYTVTNFQQKFIGVYTVSVCNRVGCEESSHHLFVSESPSHASGLSLGGDAGIGIGAGACLFMLLVAAVVIVLWRCHGRMEREKRKSSEPNPIPNIQEHSPVATSIYNDLDHIKSARQIYTALDLQETSGHSEHSPVATSIYNDLDHIMSARQIYTALDLQEIPDYEEPTRSPINN